MQVFDECERKFVTHVLPVVEHLSREQQWPDENDGGDVAHDEGHNQTLVDGDSCALQRPEVVKADTAGGPLADS